MVKNKQVPEIRFKGFTEDWKQQEFDQFAKYRNGKAHENDICDDGKYIVVNSKFCSTDGIVRKYSNKQIEPLFKNEIAFVLSDVPNGRALARTFLIDKDDKYTLNQRIAGITPSDNTDPYYLYIMMNRNKYFLQFDDGAKQTNLSTTDVFKFEERFPIKKEQEKIGSIFSQIDNLITLHQCKYEKLVNVKKSMLEKIFPKSSSKVPEIRFKGFTEDWKQSNYEEIGTCLQGGNLSYADLDEKGKNKCVLYGELYTRYDTIIKDIINKTNKVSNEIKRNDVLFPQSTTVDNWSLISPACMNDEIAYTSGVFVIRPHENIDGNFVAYYSKGNNYQHNKLAKNAQGLTIVHLYYQSIKNESILIPEYEEQKTISNLLIKLDNLIILHQCKLEKLNNIKKSMLDKMFV